MVEIPEKPSLDGLEAKWDAVWQQHGTYRFDRTKTRSEIYSVDTPPPTVSGSIHLGTAFGYVQFDAIARHQRMRGREVFFPMGWDDNGLPTERRVQNHYGVRCDPTVPYQANADPPEPSPAGGRGSQRRAIARRNFVELCHLLTAEDEKAFEDIFRRVGLSVDWSLTYATIDDRSRRVAQRAFLRNVRRGDAYAMAAPTMWDVDFQTAVAQAEIEERTAPGAYHRLAFAPVASGGGAPVEIETTRPELLVSCVALVTNPDDERYRDLIGGEVITPVFGVRVPIVAHPLADPTKGTGIAMVCTFGDTTDVVWWRELSLPIRSVIGRDGRFQNELPSWVDDAAVWERLAGRTATAARTEMVALLGSAGALLGEPRAITHELKYFEKGDRPLEIVTSRQWYIRNGARDEALRGTLLDLGRELAWHPDFMRVRYEHWVGGLNTDWLISRQRYFGVPFPVWYPVDTDGQIRLDEPILCDESALPVDPQSDAPPGFREDQRGAPGGFIGDPDVMDTWATSSLTPYIGCGWVDDADLFDRTFPMDLRPQGPEIIRTWLFATVLRSYLEHGQLPWAHASINGWILDPDRKKMSKSRGNTLTPGPLVDQFGADGLRYWSCRAAPGTDTAADTKQMQVGRRLAVKILNASKFVLGLGVTPGASALVTEPLDRAMLTTLMDVVSDATDAFDSYQYHRALERTERFFWQFCDDYVELVKVRAYGQGAPASSAQTALSLALSTLLRLFAPFLPFVTEEVWSWWRSGSVHRAPWPSATELASPAKDGQPLVLAVAASVLAEVRKAKTSQKLSLRTAVSRLIVEDSADRLAALRAAESDLRAAGVLDELLLHEAAQPLVKVELTTS